MSAVSVVIPAYNAAHTIGGTLKALQAQSDAPEFETIVVDNASTDDTAHVARQCGATVLYEQRRGPAAARNCGLRHASGEIIAHLDADTVPSRR
jgi:glycosyltransferase involved in cell wall biosynthesis